jgi:hypothetical protein
MGAKLRVAFCHPDLGIGGKHSDAPISWPLDSSATNKTTNTFISAAVEWQMSNKLARRC